MKTITLLTSFIFTVGFLFAQEFSVKYEISMKSSDPAVQSQLGMMQGSTLQIYAKDKKSRTEMSMGGLMTTTTVLDGNKKKGVLIMDGMLGKQAATFDEEMNEEDEEVSEKDIEIEFVDETKIILGYKCKKAIIYTEEGMELVYWYTEEIDPTEGSLGKYVRKEVPGLALEFSVDQPQMTMVFTATEFKEKVKETKGMFDISIPEGYTEKSFEEISNMSGQ
jgi:GLPGLI family protein